MFQSGFPKEIRDDVMKVISLLLQKNVDLDPSEERIQYIHHHKVIVFPYRVYYEEMPVHSINELNEKQRMILHCMYTRHCDGYVRQKHLKALLLMDFEDWAIPYIVKICDEYVVEIIEMVYELLKDRPTEAIKTFCVENVTAFCKSYSRMTSYWNEYYREQYTDFHKYIGRKLFRECFGYTRSMERLAHNS